MIYFPDPHALVSKTDDMYEMPLRNQAGVNVRLRATSRVGLCQQIFALYPRARVEDVARAAGVGVSTAYSVRSKDSRKRIKAAYEKKATLPVNAIATPEEDEAFKQIEANAMQVGGNHYKGKAVQPWDYIASNNLGYLEGNIVKYVSRWKDKGGIEDLKKAMHYLAKLIEVNE